MRKVSAFEENGLVCVGTCDYPALPLDIEEAEQLRADLLAAIKKARNTPRGRYEAHIRSEIGSGVIVGADDQDKPPPHRYIR